MRSPISNSAPAGVASSALSTAADALRVCASAINALDARVAFLEEALAATRDRVPAPPTPHVSVRPVPPCAAAIDLETRSHVDTATAARWLSRRPQTLRAWACFEDGPLRAIRVNGRLKWSVADIRALLAAPRA